MRQILLACCGTKKRHQIKFSIISFKKNFIDFALVEALKNLRLR